MTQSSPFCRVAVAGRVAPVPVGHLSKWRAATVSWSISAILEATVVAIVKVVVPISRMVNSYWKIPFEFCKIICYKDVDEFI